MGLADSFPGASVQSIIDKVIKPQLIAPGSAEMERRVRMERRLQVYEDDWLMQLRDAISEVWEEEVALERKKLAKYARFQNIVRKISRLVATVYAEKARREPGTKKAGDKKALKAYADAVHLDEVLRDVDRKLVFLNDMFILIRARDVAGEMVPVLDTVAPHAFSVIADPRDPRSMVAIVLDTKPNGPFASNRDPHHEVWADDVMFRVDRTGDLVGQAVENPYGTIPGVLCHRDRMRSTLLDENSGQDLFDAQMSVALLNVMLLHGQKTGTRAPYVSGDTVQMDKGQVLDHDRVLVFPEGTTPGVLELGHDPASILATEREVINQIGANYDIPGDVYSLSHDATSGFDRQLKRAGLDERRRERIPNFRDIEAELMRKASAVLAKVADAKYHVAPTVIVDFGEVRTPQDPMQLLQWRKLRRSLMLASVFDDIREDNPDLSEDAAMERFMANIKNRAIEITSMRALNAPRDPTDPGVSPEMNGSGAQPGGDVGSPDGVPQTGVAPAVTGA